MPECRLHNVRFYNPKPLAAYCMSLQQIQKKLAVSRSDASVEIWDLNDWPHKERTIPCTAEFWSVEGLSWCGDRLFSVGLHGYLLEYNLRELSSKNVATVTGQAAYCLDINRDYNQIAIGTEQGYINVFAVNETDVLFDKFLDKQEGKVLCIKYNKEGDFLVSGSEDAIRVWDVKSGHALHRMTTGRSEKEKSTIVWCLAVLDDFTIISGDSRGKINFWDGKVGAQIDSCQSHRADVLTLCVSEDQKSLYCAGVDPLIINYVKVHVKDDNYKWVKSIQRKVHDHDVRALALIENKVYSSGIDGYLACSYHPPKTLIKYPPILQNPCVTVAQQAQLILLRYSQHLEVWSLGQSEQTKGLGIMPLKQEPQLILKISKIAKDQKKSGKGENIIFSSISNNGELIAYATDSTMRVFRLSYITGSKPQLSRLNLPDECSVSLQGVFTPCNTQLILAPRSGGLQIYNINNEAIDHLHSIKTESALEDTITFLMVSANGEYLLAADPKGNIAVWKYTKQWQFYCKLPRYQSSPTAIAIDPKRNNVVAAYADQKLVEYSLKERQFTQFSKDLDETDENYMGSWFPVRNITFDPRKEGVLILHTDVHIIVLHQLKSAPKKGAKIPRVEYDVTTRLSFNIIRKYKHLVHLGWLADDEMVAVEVTPLSILKQLPPCLKQYRFGTK